LETGRGPPECQFRDSLLRKRILVYQNGLEREWGRLLATHFGRASFYFLDSRFRGNHTGDRSGSQREKTEKAHGTSAVREGPLTRPACRSLAVAALAGLSRQGERRLVPSPGFASLRRPLDSRGRGK
jgi:hypothetical protein